MTRTASTPANTAAALARYPSLTIGSMLAVEPHHAETLPAGLARLLAVYETGSAVLVEWASGERAYVWDTQVTVCPPGTEHAAAAAAEDVTR